MANSCELSQRFQVRETRFAIKHTDAHRVLTYSPIENPMAWCMARTARIAALCSENVADTVQSWLLLKSEGMSSAAAAALAPAPAEACFCKKKSRLPSIIRCGASVMRKAGHLR